MIDKKIKPTRSLTVVVRVTPDERAEIERRAQKANRLLSDYMRLSALGKL